jgi:heptosyltransferase III
MTKSTKQLNTAWAFMAALLMALPIEGTAALRNFLLAGCLFAFVWHISKIKGWRDLRYPLISLWELYALIAVANLIWAVDFGYSLSEIRHEVLLAVIFFWIGVNVFSQGGRFGLQWLIGPLLVGNVFLVSYCLIAWLLGETTVGGLHGSFKMGVGNFSTYLVTVLPFIAWFAWDRFSSQQRVAATLLFCLLIANVAAIVATENRLALVAVALEVIVLIALNTHLLRQPRLLVVSVSILLALGALFYLQTTSRGYAGSVAEVANVSSALQSDGRLGRWKFAIGQAMEHPLTGGGMGRETFKHLNAGEEITQHRFVHTHNMLVNRLVQLGVPGLLAFICLFWSLAWVIWANKNRSSLAKSLAIAGVIMSVGVFAKNMTDDLFMRELGYLYWLLGGTILGIQSREKRAPEDMQRFLVVRRDNIGDLLCTTPLIHGLRDRYPQARIDALVNSYNAPVLAGNPDLNHIYAYTKAKHRASDETVLGVHFRRLWLLWCLRRTAYNVVILAGDGNVDRQLGLARWLAAGQIIGFKPENGRSVQGLDVAVQRSERGHEVERTYALLAPLGITGEPPALVLVPEAGLVVKGKAAVENIGGSGFHGKTIAIHISARKIPQRWPIERFAELMRLIHEAEGSRFVVFWSAGDKENPLHPGDDRKAAKLLEMVADLPVAAYPTHELPELIAGLSLCDQMICADGGAMHIGAALGLPIVCLFGNSDAERWRPWGVAYQLLQTPSRDVNDLQVCEVLNAYVALGVAKDNQSTMPFAA